MGINDVMKGVAATDINPYILWESIQANLGEEFF
jgi:hypothetical protein